MTYATLTAFTGGLYRERDAVKGGRGGSKRTGLTRGEERFEQVL